MKLKAFTLVEVIVAIIILIIVIAGVFAVFKSGEKFSTEDKQKKQVVNVTRQVLEHLEEVALKNFYDPKLSTGVHDDPVSELGINDPLVDKVEEREFFYEVVPSPDTGPSGPVYKKVNVTYRWKFWKKKGAEPETVTLSTIVANPDVEPSPVSEPFP